MSTLEGVCAASDDLAALVKQYLALRKADRLWDAGQVRKKLGAAAEAAEVASLDARATARKAMRSAKPLNQWTPSGAIPLPPRPANDSSPSMGGTIA